MIFPFLQSYLCVFLSHSDYANVCDQQNIVEMTDCDFEARLYKTLWIPPCSLVVTCSGEASGHVRMFMQPELLLLDLISRINFSATLESDLLDPS